MAAQSLEHGVLARRNIGKSIGFEYSADTNSNTVGLKAPRIVAAFAEGFDRAERSLQVWRGALFRGNGSY